MTFSKEQFAKLEGRSALNQKQVQVLVGVH
jgi:hypothetical protein